MNRRLYPSWDAIARIRARHPGARFAFHTPAGRRAAFEVARLVFGRALEAQYRFDLADVVVSLDADFLAAMPNSVRWSHDFAARRRLPAPDADMSRLYVAEPRPTPTGSLADHRLPVRGPELRAIAAALLAAVEGRAPGGLSDGPRRWVAAAARDLRGGRGLVVVGDRQPRDVHALGHLINQAIGAIGTTVAFTRPPVIEPLGDDLAALTAALAAGQVQTLVIAEANPVYTAPPDLGFSAQLTRVPETIYAGLGHDETARSCHWFLPLAHYMESWGDARGHDGTITWACAGTARCTGCGSTPTGWVPSMIRGTSTSRCCASTARTRRATTCARSTRPSTAPTGCAPRRGRWLARLERRAPLTGASPPPRAPTHG